MELDAFDSNGKISVEEFIYRLQQLSPAVPVEQVSSNEKVEHRCLAFGQISPKFTGRGTASSSPERMGSTASPSDQSPARSGRSEDERNRRASFETLFPRRPTFEASHSLHAGVAEGAFVALMEVATMLTTLVPSSCPTLVADTTDSDNVADKAEAAAEAAKLFMEELVADSIWAALQPPCMLRQYLPMRIELVKQLGALTAAAHHCRAAQCETQCLEALQVRGNIIGHARNNM